MNEKIIPESAEEHIKIVSVISESKETVDKEKTELQNNKRNDVYDSQMINRMFDAALNLTSNDIKDKEFIAYAFKQHEKLEKREFGYKIRKTLIAGITIIFCFVAADKGLEAATGKGLFEVIFDHVNRFIGFDITSEKRELTEDELLADLVWMPDGYVVQDKIESDIGLTKTVMTKYRNESGEKISFSRNAYRNKSAAQAHGDFEEEDTFVLKGQAFIVGKNMDDSTIVWIDAKNGASYHLYGVVDIEILKEIIYRNFK